MRRIIAIVLIVVQLPILVHSQSTALVNVAAAFAQVPQGPVKYYFTNKRTKAPAGGHLQGIQGWNENGRDYIVVTASSASNAYCFTAEISKRIGKGQLLALVNIGHSPLRHAGGSQLQGNLLAVGVEDNISKDSSHILLLPINPTLGPGVSKIDLVRRGTYKRSTAGAVGQVNVNGHTIMAVGDWDSRNIDFYFFSNRPTYDSVLTFSTDKAGCPYQNISLVSDVNGAVYLIGTGLCNGKNTADLYNVKFSGTAATMQLLSRRTFNCSMGAGFRYGAGIRALSSGQIIIYTCQRNLHKVNVINVFGKPDRAE